ncbi:hypothetical protein BS47DRAFT_1363052 [Hydnum rufescens UP504]|uniref:Uncharacterized protein n=1 Tax=Hydnum rufescens UP504 TaxID=1448309 RepID=A0A9P6DVG3_9AGAM|nr:hypothetical protein BS47DRAFT_1363052 [Hydnum rufescens UP504]
MQIASRRKELSVIATWGRSCKLLSEEGSLVADKARGGDRNGDCGGGKIVAQDLRSGPVMTMMKEDKKMAVLQNSNEHEAKRGAPDSGVDMDVGVPEPEREGEREKNGERLGCDHKDSGTAGSVPGVGVLLLLRMDIDMARGESGNMGMALLGKRISRSPSMSTTDSISTSGSWPRNGGGDTGRLLVDAKEDRVGEGGRDIGSWAKGSTTCHPSPSLFPSSSPSRSNLRLDPLVFLHPSGEGRERHSGSPSSVIASPALSPALPPEQIHLARRVPTTGRTAPLTSVPASSIAAPSLKMDHEGGLLRVLWLPLVSSCPSSDGGGAGGAGEEADAAKNAEDVEGKRARSLEGRRNIEVEERRTGQDVLLEGRAGCKGCAFSLDGLLSGTSRPHAHQRGQVHRVSHAFASMPGYIVIPFAHVPLCDLMGDRYYGDGSGAGRSLGKRVETMGIEHEGDVIGLWDDEYGVAEPCGAPQHRRPTAILYGEVENTYPLFRCGKRELSTGRAALGVADGQDSDHVDGG